METYKEILSRHTGETGIYLEKGMVRGSDAIEAHEEYLNQPKTLEKKNVDLFGEKVPEIYFVGVPVAQDGGFMMADCGKANDDEGAYWVITTTGLKADEIPEECTNASTFAQLVAKLLNEYYNK